MTFTEFFQLVTGLISLPIAVGILFAVLIQPRRSRESWYFAFFAGMVALWALATLLRGIQDPEIMPEKEKFWLQVTGLVMSIISFFIFATNFIETQTPAMRWLVISALILAPIITLLTWTELLIDWKPDEIVFTPIGFVVLGISVLYLLYTYIMLRQEKSQRSRALELPALILLIGMAGNVIPTLNNLPYDTLMTTIAVAIAGWHVLNMQLVNPMQEINRALQLVNDNLISAYDELAEEKDKVEILNDELRRASKYKSEFLANMSHELRTPLNSIVGYSELLLQKIYGDINAQQADRIEKINRNGKNLLALINDILDLSKIEAGRLELQPETLNIADLVEDLRNTIEPLVGNKPLQFIIDADPDLHPIYADRIRVHQVLLNFLSNAVKFTARGQVTLKLKNVVFQNGQDTHVKPPMKVRDGEWVLACVEDSGIGIAEENLDTIFEEFRQADGSTTREFGGTGLGLAIAKRLVEMQNGHIWAESKLGAGSRFYMLLPADTTHLNAQVIHTHIESHNADMPTVLVIEDSVDSADILTVHLRQAGYQVVWASGGMTGIEQAQALQPDVITVDIMMPGMNGWEVIAHLKEHPLTANIPVIISSIVDERVRGMEIGASAYILKPIDRDKLLGALASIQSQINPNTPILIVDDDPNEREILAAYLNSAGYQSEQLPDGEAAIQWLDSAETLPALILLDLMMPRVSGFDVLRHIRSNARLAGLPVLIVTAKTLNPGEREFLNANTSSVLAKHGLTDVDLIQQIRTLLQKM